MLRKYLNIYKACIRVSFATASTYRVNFLLNTSIMLFSNILFPIVTLLIYGSGAGFPDWSFYEVLLIQSIFILSTGIANMFFNGVLYMTMRNVVDGTLEIVLIKPVDMLFFLLASTFEIESIGLLAGGGIVFAIAVSHVEAINMWVWLQFLLLFFVGNLVMLGIALMMAATSFKWVGNSRIPEIFDSVKAFGKYPQSIFPKAVTGFTSFIFPVAMIGFFPASVLLGKATQAMFVAVLPCIAFAVAGVLVYKHMVRRYEGAGG